ncbi:fasciclin-2 isoform X1 [Cimex lectularius]|uniref:Fasciclin-2 n=1 Tax=Cimex lectularius TaxID=79782 RepID=A0A8I6SE80_CIMLE|nr:fasciclin-2 isoform X1 [Cimex lectularius]
MAISKQVFVTCNPSDPNLVTNLMWLDVRNNEVKKEGPEKSRLSTLVLGSDGKLALVFSEVEENDSGNYTCQATYAGSQTIKKSVYIQTYRTVTWEDAPKEQYPELGKDFKVRCRVTGKPAPRVEWKINDNFVKNDERFIVETDGLLIRNVQRTDDGIYTCRAFVLDTGELSERQIKVEVHIPPSFENPTSETKEVVDGESASVSCKATGKPDPTYKWIKGSSRADLSMSSDRFAVNDKTGDLTITKVTHEDNGDFICFALNAAGRAEKIVRFTVVIKPQVMDVKNVSFVAGETAILTCKATGNPLPAITFRKFTSPNRMIAGLQPNEDRIIVNQKEDFEKGQSIGTLTIKKLERKDDGLYACIAKNKGGEATKNGHITVEFRPSFENSPMKEAWSWDRRPVNITCVAESIPNATITWKLNNRDIEKDPNFRKFGHGPQSTLLVTPSDRKFYGHYKCVGRNLHGEAEHTIELKEAKVPSEVAQAKIEVITATTITFSFVSPNDHGGRPIKAYVVQYKKDRETWQESLNKTWPRDSPYILEGLEPQVQYFFRFAALNDVGLSSWGANQQHIMPKRSSPEEPIILNKPIPPHDYVISPFGDRYELRWKKPADNGEYIDSYMIKYCVVNRINNAWEETDRGCEKLELKSTELTSTIINNLASDSFYKVEIWAHNIIGFSTPGQLFLQTARGSDTMMYHNSDAHLSSSLLIVVVVAALLVILIIVDVSCFFVNDTGILWLMCGKKKARSTREEDAKLGSEAKGLLKNGNQDGKIRIEGTDSYKRDTTVEYDMKKSVSRTSFVGKDSAV